MEGSGCFSFLIANSRPPFQLKDNIFVTTQSLKDNDEKWAKGLVLNECCSRLNNGLQRFQVLIPGTFECYLLWKKNGVCVWGVIADEIKLRILGEEGPALSGGP